MFAPFRSLDSSSGVAAVGEDAEAVGTGDGEFNGLVDGGCDADATEVVRRKKKGISGHFDADPVDARSASKCSGG
ncbi:MAG: hypothetical protein WBD20_26835 [Pirellulaceae bacterium]